MKKIGLVMTFFLLLLPAAVFADGHVSRITKEELKAKMDKGEDILILDMRAKGSYDGSSFKIKGGVRLSPDEVESNVPKDKEIVTYCT